MIRLTIAEIAEAIGAEYTGADAYVDYISTDSRDVHGKCLFVALVGERVDGHDYIAKVLENPNCFAVAHKLIPDDIADGRVLYVEDTFEVLMQIAKMYKAKFELLTVAVTGSVGKTTTKEFVAQVLMAEHSTLKSRGNNNNEIGLPKTVFRLDSDYTAAVFEMGMDKKGDISKLADIVKPNIGVITNIGVSHIGKLGSQENIFAEKMDITTGMTDGSTLILCGDDEFLSGVKMPRLKVLFYGIDNKSCDVTAGNIGICDDRTSFTVTFAGGSCNVVIPAIGRHNVYDALAAFTVGLDIGISPEKMVRALAEYEPSGMRQHVREHNGITVVEDCYNASPDSMRAALTTLSGYKCSGRRIAVLADMLELGSISAKSHREIGELAVGCADILYAYGEQAKLYVQAAHGLGMANAEHFTAKRELTEALLKEAKSGDVIWVKGSRGMELEDILDDIYKA